MIVVDSGDDAAGTGRLQRGVPVFPAATLTERGHTQTYRSRWQRSGDDAYEVVTEFQESDRWMPAFSLHMQRVTWR